MTTALLPPPSSPAWAYFLDFDGTLINLAPTPDSVRVDEAMVRLVERLHQRCDGAVALVTGRALADLDTHMRLGHIPAAGQHGLEWRDASGQVHRHGTDKDLRTMASHLAMLKRRYRQLLIEDKGMSIALHYRMTPRLGGYLHRWVRSVVTAEGDQLDVLPGKRVIEIKPRGIDKGRVIETFMVAPPFAGRTPVVIGDDLTDEHGFAVVNHRNGLSIKVGPGRTQARYRLQNVAAVLAWLRHAAEAT